ncbi:MAG TPA: hypothetical protein V6D10_05900 [Trichocoleus sp.]|jgi:hypothetical protein
MMVNLTIGKSLPDTLISIEMKLQRLGWLTLHREGCRRVVSLHEPRLVFWAVACLEQAGWSKEVIIRMLDSQPVSRHWWVLRQMLPDDALYTLDAKLDQIGGVEDA